MRGFRAMIGLVAAVTAAGNPAGAQPAGRPLRVGLMVAHGGSWDLAIRTGAFVNRQASYPAGWSVGIGAGYDIVPRVAIAGQAEWNGGGFGDSSGWTRWSLGLEGRPLGLGGAMPFVTGAVGRTTESGGVRFGFGAAGAGLEVRLAGRITGRVAGEVAAPFSAGLGADRGEGQTASVSATMARLTLAIGARF